MFLFDIPNNRGHREQMRVSSFVFISKDLYVLLQPRIINKALCETLPIPLLLGAFQLKRQSDHIRRFRLGIISGAQFLENVVRLRLLLVQFRFVVERDDDQRDEHVSDDERDDAEHATRVGLRIHVAVAHCRHGYYC